MDSLSEVLASCRIQDAVTAKFLLRGPWALSSSGVPGAMIRIAQGKPYWLEVQGATPCWVEPGDWVLLPTGAAHTMASAPGLPATSFTEMIARHAKGLLDAFPLYFQHGGAGALTYMHSSLLWVNAQARHNVLALLPPLLHVPAKQSRLLASWQPGFAALVEHSMLLPPGWRLEAARMGELILAHLLSQFFSAETAGAQGWWRGMADLQVAKALALMHRAPRQAWTVQSLASAAGMSRSRFAERFKELVGIAPIAYLAHYRMAQAAEQLETELHLPLAVIAEQAGYESERVFARAFKRWTGCAPRAYQQQVLEKKRVFARQLQTPV
ncbi:AraC family transcriptional regulator [Lampropedia aestuarii]|uniref:AraC family transcriptional regulator n=1 Tax=Lampropedia aestuarii TaxID=2562762 RepID=UPI002468EEF4|nr:AraC family transcriptional regulator [Lampropedia aestuarii]MDH5858047.1 AraC family transcriptional regulator [Lampropedia aestuarii]